jgi:hypothetical protein
VRSRGRAGAFTGAMGRWTRDRRICNDPGTEELPDGHHCPCYRCRHTRTGVARPDRPRDRRQLRHRARNGPASPRRRRRRHPGRPRSRPPRAGGDRTRRKGQRGLRRHRPGRAQAVLLQPDRPDRPRDGHGPRPVLRAPGRPRPGAGAPGFRRASVAGHHRRAERRRPGTAGRHAAFHERYRRPPARARPVAHFGGHRRAARPDRQPGRRGGADPGQPHRGRLRGLPLVGHAARRRPRQAARPTPRHLAGQAGYRAGRRRLARRVPHDQHRRHRRDLRHRRRPAADLRLGNVMPPVGGRRGDSLGQ